MGLSKKLAVGLVGLVMGLGLVMIGAFSLDQLACEGQFINRHDPARSNMQQIRGQQSIGQSFIPSRNRLNRIDVLFQTYHRRNTHEITLRLLEVGDKVDQPLQGTEIFRTAFQAAAIRDGVWQEFTFPPILESAGKTYLIVLESPDSTPENALAVGGIEDPGDVYKAGMAFLGPMPATGADMTFRLCYELTSIEKIEFLLARLTAHRPALWGQPGFYLFCLGGYGLLIVLFFGSLMKRALR